MMGLEVLRRSLSRIGPYVVMELVLPGGTLFALLLYLYRRRVDKPTMPMAIWRAADRLRGVGLRLLGIDTSDSRLAARPTAPCCRTPGCTAN